MICKNCTNEYEGNYCNQCGQTAKTGRLDWQFFRHNFQHSILHFDRGFLYTAKQFFIRPGDAAKDFFSGKRSKYTGPFAYFLISSVFFYIITKYLMTEPIVENQVFKYVEKYYSKIILFLIIPLYVLLTKLFFPKSGYNFYELFTFHCYMQVQFMMIEIVVSSIDWSLVHLYIFLDYNTINSIKIGVEVIFMSWAFMQLFEKRNFLVCFVKSLLITAAMVAVYGALFVAAYKIL